MNAADKVGGGAGQSLHHLEGLFKESLVLIIGSPYTLDVGAFINNSLIFQIFALKLLPETEQWDGIRLGKAVAIFNNM